MSVAEVALYAGFGVALWCAVVSPVRRTRAVAGDDRALRTLVVQTLFMQTVLSVPVVVVVDDLGDGGWPLVALVGVPAIIGATVALGRVAIRRRWPVGPSTAGGVSLVVAVTSIVVAGVTTG